MINVLYANEKKGEYPNSYYLASADPLPPFPVLKGEHKADVCIIGAGFCGLSTALHLAQRGYNVAILDAHRIGWGASGRNGGQVGSGQRVDQQSLADMVGPEDARKLWFLGQEAKQLVAKMIDQYSIDCDYQSGVMEVNHRRRFGHETEQYVDFLRSEYGYEHISFVPEDELREILATDAYFNGTLDVGAGHLHPLRYAVGLAKACRDHGVTFFEQSQALDIQESNKVVVKTDGGQVTADHVVLAANGYVGGLNKHTADRVMPINNFVIATEPLDDDLAQSLISNNAAIADSNFVINYYRLSSDKRMLWGGRESYRYRFPQDVKSYVRAAMLRIYPQMEKVRVDYGWGGVVGVTMNRMPHFEWLSHRILTMGGYSGHGVALATLAGSLGADAIAGSAERFSLMERVPTTAFPGGAALRLPLLALGMAYYSLRDRLP
ncbi:MAG: FAD-binding oxidoreductase [Pseudomonadota bacterium]